MKYLIVIFVYITSGLLWTQTTVANLNNVPILLHPSMVGSTETKRVGAVYGINQKSVRYLGDKGDRVEDVFPTNYVNLSYDQLWKKIGSGVGAYINIAAIPKQNGAEYDYLEPYSKLQSREIATGVSFAPKYCIMKRKAYDQIWFTWVTFFIC